MLIHAMWCHNWQLSQQILSWLSLQFWRQTLQVQGWASKCISYNAVWLLTCLTRDAYCMECLIANCRPPACPHAVAWVILNKPFSKDIYHMETCYPKGPSWHRLTRLFYYCLLLVFYLIGSSKLKLLALILKHTTKKLAFICVKDIFNNVLTRSAVKKLLTHSTMS